MAPEPPPGTAQLVVAAIVRRGDSVLLVHQHTPWTPEQPWSWSIPGGLVDPGELLHEALARELREETGLECLSLGAVAYAVQLQSAPADAMVLVFEAVAGDGDPVPDDPGGIVHEARFLPVADAVARLSELRFTPMREPPVAYLTGTAERGATWLYRGADPAVALPANLLDRAPPSHRR